MTSNILKSNMKFIIEKSTNSSGRLGTLIIGSGDKENKFQTPVLIQSTKGGSIPHLSKEVFEHVSTDTHIMQLNLASTYYMAESVAAFKPGTSSFIGFKDAPILMTMKDPCEETSPGFNEKEFVPMFTKRGKELITIESYIKAIEAFQPDLYPSLSDSDTNAESSKKRLRKSLDRTKSFFQQCLENHKTSETLSTKSLLAPIVGGFCKETRTYSAQAVKGVPEVSGYVLEGFHNNGVSAMNVNLDSLKDVVSHISSELNDDKLKIMSGAYTPLTVLEMIRLGVDVFDTSYPYVAMRSHRALTFKFDEGDLDNSSFSLLLSDIKYKNDFAPLLEGCTCLACRKHTRAYIYHLIEANELLAPILLMIHNIHHYMQFFGAIRQSVSNDTLPKLIELISKQIPANVEEEFREAYEDKSKKLKLDL